MPRLPSLLIALVVFGVLLVGCQKLPEQPVLEASFDLEQVTSTDAIPMDYGELIAVTRTATNPHWSDLWFQKSDKTIVVVRVNASVGTMYDRVLTIPRR